MSHAAPAAAAYGHRMESGSRLAAQRIPTTFPNKVSLRHRASTDYARGEKGFAYNPSAEFAVEGSDEKLGTYKYPHEKFWRK